MTYPDVEAKRRTVLVAVVNNMDDLRRAASEGWYRIPQRKAPQRVGADYLAFYQTGAFKGTDEAQTISYFAPTRRYRLQTRREMLPAEADHARANDFYFRIDIGPLQRLEKPIPAAKYLRVTFINSTLDRLLSAQDVTDLFTKDDPFEQLWGALKAHKLRPLKNRLLGERPLDITLRARGGYLGINCSDESGTKEQRPLPLHERWELLTLANSRIESDLNGCLRQIGATLIGLGGSVLNI